MAFTTMILNHKKMLLLSEKRAVAPVRYQKRNKLDILCSQFHQLVDFIQLAHIRTQAKHTHTHTYSRVRNGIYAP